MLVTAPGYRTSNGRWFAELEIGQAYELAEMLKPTTEAEMDQYRKVCEQLVKQRDHVVAVLCMKQRGRPRTVKPVKQARKAKHPPFVSQFEGERNNEEETPHVRACNVK